MMKMSKYYIAYGSNLNIEQMNRRCPHSIRVGSGILEDYELTFKYFLTVKKVAGAKTPIGIWKITDEDEKKLDIYEGYPTHYRKEYIDIEIDGKLEKGLIYIMNSIREAQPPSGTYMQTCTVGYKNFGFDLNYLNDALIRSFNGEGDEDAIH